MAQKMGTFTVVLLLIALMLEASSVGTNAIDPCTLDCTKFKADPPRFAVCQEACGFEVDVNRGNTMTTKCNEFCKAKKGAAEVKACMEPCKIFDDATRVALVVGACYTECVNNVKDPAEFGKCKEACARADKEGPKLVKGQRARPHRRMQQALQRGGWGGHCQGRKVQEDMRPCETMKLIRHTC